MCCSALSACGETRVAVALKPPPERLQCAGPGDRPRIPVEHGVDWAKVLSANDAAVTLARAQAEHGRFVASLRQREAIVARHVVEIEGRLFACANNAAWLRSFYAALPDGAPPAGPVEQGGAPTPLRR